MATNASLGCLSHSAGRAATAALSSAASRTRSTRTDESRLEGEPEASAAARLAAASAAALAAAAEASSVPDLSAASAAASAPASALLTTRRRCLDRACAMAEARSGKIDPSESMMIASPPAPPKARGIAASRATCIASCVLPTPGAPQISVKLPRATPPPRTRSRPAQKVMILGREERASARSRAAPEEAPRIEERRPRGAGGGKADSLRAAAACDVGKESSAS